MRLKPEEMVEMAKKFLGMALAVKPERRIKPKYMVVSKTTHVTFNTAHLKNGASLRRLVKKYGPHKALEMAPELANATVNEVPCVVLRRIDYSRYTGEKLRKIRAEQLRKALGK